MGGNLHQSFKLFCDTVKKGSTTATDKTIKKMCQDCQLYCKGMDANRVDIQFRKHTGSTKKDVDFADFVRFIEGTLAEAYMNAMNLEYEDAVKQLKDKIANGRPAGHKVTKVSNDSATVRLTDTKGYTGAHKERFDDGGHGKGIDGREYLVTDNAASGYVGGYKGKDTYDRKH